MKQFLFILAMIATVIAPANVDAKTAPARKPAQVDSHLAAPGDAKQATEAEIEKTEQQKAEDALVIGSWQVEKFDCELNERRLRARLFHNSMKSMKESVDFLVPDLRERVYRDAQGKLQFEGDPLFSETIRINHILASRLGHKRCRVLMKVPMSFDRKAEVLSTSGTRTFKCRAECSEKDCQELQNVFVSVMFGREKFDEQIKKMPALPILSETADFEFSWSVIGSKTIGVYREPVSFSDNEVKSLIPCEDLNTKKPAGSAGFFLKFIN